MRLQNEPAILQSFHPVGPLKIAPRRPFAPKLSYAYPNPILSYYKLSYGLHLYSLYEKLRN